ncbi:hypothetical protein HAX54_052405 [Datura stramonium]|uniref:Uncharacterized protein n=1 Tax=Datura stramonium TaxID=4076 RepID=A0ABS8WS64_DATST|nr:hypothetical protein [Datura stramonium]
MSLDALFSFDGDTVAANVETTSVDIADLVVYGDTLFYAPLKKWFFIPWATDLEEVESLINSVILKKFKFKKDCSHNSFRDDTTSLRIGSIIHYDLAVDGCGISHVKINYGWFNNINVLFPFPSENICSFKPSFMGVYTYPFAMGFSRGPIFMFIIQLCEKYTLFISAKWLTILESGFLSPGHYLSLGARPHPRPLHSTIEVGQRKAHEKGILKKKKRKDTGSEFPPFGRDFKKTRGAPLEKIVVVGGLSIGCKQEATSFREILTSGIEAISWRESFPSSDLDQEIKTLVTIEEQQSLYSHPTLQVREDILRELPSQDEQLLLKQTLYHFSRVKRDYHDKRVNNSGRGSPI